MDSSPSIVWFRQDLRLADNPALAAAQERGGPVVPVFVWSPDEETDWPPGGATRWWLHRSLARLERSLRERGSRLVIARGPSGDTLHALVKNAGAEAVYWNRRYEPAAIARDSAIKSRLRQEGIEAESHNGNLLFEPWTIKTGSGTPFKVFTPFWRKCLDQGAPEAALKTPRKLVAPEHWPSSVPLDDLGLQPRIAWDAGLRDAWTPGEAGAAAELKRFLHSAVSDYQAERDRPDHDGTSRLSPFLHFGEISPRQVWHAVNDSLAKHAGGDGDSVAEPYLRQLVWREFAHHLLFHFPHTPREPLRPEFQEFPWDNDAQALRAWQQGRTGYPYIDAGMRQLWTTGWMHNRVRMAVASFLVKDLLIPWQAGAKWFWDTLVDADLANNTLGWQWTAGCGADAAPYFRVFNPVGQGQKFDPEGEYIRRFVPELAQLPGEHLHEPWKAPPGVLADAGITLGETYPRPIVDHAAARLRALAALEAMKARRRAPVTMTK